MNKADTLTRKLKGQGITRTQAPAAGSMAGIIDHTRRQLGFSDHTPVGMAEPTHRTAKAPAIMGTLELHNERAALDLLAVGVNPQTMGAFSLRALGVNGGAGTPLYGDGSNAAGTAADTINAFDLFKTVPAVALAGATIREFPAERGRLVKSDLATFQAVADDADAPDAGVEFGEFGTWDLGDDASVSSYGCTITATRKLEKLVGRDNLETLLTRALVLGAVKVVDQVTLTAITTARVAGTAPGLADLVAAGADLRNQRAIIGTASHAGQTFIQGHAYFHGITAHGSDQLSSAALVGDFSSVVVLVEPELRIVSKRLDAAGNLEMSAWIDVKPILMEPGRLFNVAGA